MVDEDSIWKVSELVRDRMMALVSGIADEHTEGDMRPIAAFAFGAVAVLAVKLGCDVDELHNALDALASGGFTLADAAKAIDKAKLDS